MFDEQVGHCQRHRRAVYQDRRPPFQQFGGHHIGALGAANGLERRPGPVPDQFLHIVGIQHAVDLDLFHPLAHLSQYFLIGDPFDVTQAHGGLALLAALQILKFQVGRAQLAADHR